MKDGEAEHTESLLHTAVRWLSRAKNLARFPEVLPEVKHFLSQAKLDDEQWIVNLAFLSDFSAVLNEQN